MLIFSPFAKVAHSASTTPSKCLIDPRMLFALSARAGNLFASLTQASSCRVGSGPGSHPVARGGDLLQKLQHSISILFRGLVEDKRPSDHSERWPAPEVWEQHRRQPLAQSLLHSPFALPPSSSLPACGAILSWLHSARPRAFF